MLSKKECIMVGILILIVGLLLAIGIRVQGEKENGNELPIISVMVNGVDIKNGDMLNFSVNEIINLDSSKSSDLDGQIASASWNMGDGSAVKFGKTTTHFYTAEGTYSILVKVTDDVGGESLLAFIIVVTDNEAIVPVNLPPTAKASAPQVVVVGTNVAFTASDSSDPDGDNLTYAWDFGDDTHGVGLSPTHTYTHEGNYTVVLTVSDGHGHTAVNEIGVTVVTQFPQSQIQEKDTYTYPAENTTLHLYPNHFHDPPGSYHSVYGVNFTVFANPNSTNIPIMWYLNDSLVDASTFTKNTTLWLNFTNCYNLTSPGVSVNFIKIEIGEFITYVSRPSYYDSTYFTIKAEGGDSKNFTYMWNIVLLDCNGTIVERISLPNRQPIITSFTPSQQTVSLTTSETEAAFAVKALDLDNDTLSYYWYLDGVNCTIDRNDTYILKPDKVNVGTHVLKVKISDNNSDKIIAWIITIKNETSLPQPINHLPVIRGFETDNACIFVLNTSERFEYRISASDPDGDNLTYKLNTTLLTIDSNGTIRGSISTPGKYEFEITVNDTKGESSETFVVTVNEAVVMPSTGAEEQYNFGMMLFGLFAVCLTSTVLVVLLTKIGVFGLLSLVVPLYAKVKKEKVLDGFLRGQIYVVIREHPGIHYNGIREKLEIGNGVLAYHLYTLEREGFIAHNYDGIMKRFYPTQNSKIFLGAMKIDDRFPQKEVCEEGIRYSTIQQKILQAINENPGISQNDIVKKTGLSRQIVSYNVKRLCERAIVSKQRISFGKGAGYYIAYDDEDKVANMVCG